jgi:hypothetical protein
MLTFEASQPYDMAVFFESFCHCSDHFKMLTNLRSIVKATGKVAFVAEPIGSFRYPGCPRLDGLSLFCTRSYGWLEPLPVFDQ